MTFLVVADGAPSPGGAFDSHITLQTAQPSANVMMSFEQVATVLGRPLTTLEDDWLHLLAVIHAADLACRRGENEEYTRSIHLALRLRDPAPFRLVVPHLREIFDLLANDALSISLDAWPTAQPATLPHRTGPRAAPPAGATQPFDAVSLLSGGVDSAAAAAVLLEAGARPIFVSSRSATWTARAQGHVTEALANRFGRTFAHVPFGVTTKRRVPGRPLSDPDPSQRSRTLLFAGVAALVAHACGIDRVVLGENGVMAINCPLTTARIASFSTHTAHPNVLAAMGRLFSQVFGSSLQIHNPFAFETKTEVVRRLQAAGLADLLPTTHSCWNTRWKDQCGQCVPCLVRRFSATAAGAPDTKYRHDIFMSPIDPSKSADLADYLIFASTLARSSDEELRLAYTELNIGTVADSGAAIAMHRRWADDVLGVARQQPALAGLL